MSRDRVFYYLAHQPWDGASNWRSSLLSGAAQRSDVAEKHVHRLAGSLEFNNTVGMNSDLTGVAATGPL